MDIPTFSLIFYSDQFNSLWPATRFQSTGRANVEIYFALSLKFFLSIDL